MFLIWKKKKKKNSFHLAFAGNPVKPNPEDPRSFIGTPCDNGASVVNENMECVPWSVGETQRNGGGLPPVGAPWNHGTGHLDEHRNCVPNKRRWIDIIKWSLIYITNK